VSPALEEAAGREIYRLSGAGNDFLALPAPERPPDPREIRAWCTRGLSLGADGVFTLEPAGTGRVRMVHYNADGGEAALCLNGTRCAARLAFELGWATGDRVTVETGAGALAARRLDATGVALEAPLPTREPARFAPDVDGRPWPGWAVTVGVPHFVLFWPDGTGSAGGRATEPSGDLAEAPVVELGARLRRHPVFGEAGANVDFVRVTGPGSLAIRSFERGVEGETLACGTGVLAAVAAGLAEGVLRFPVDALTRGGLVLRVEGEAKDDGRLVRWSLAGDARLLAHGRVLPEATRLPGLSAP
jgi:diaminopimelate epimerase